MAAITKNRNFFKWPKLIYKTCGHAEFWPFEEISIIVMAAILDTGRR
jgi:hypothetical protein